MDLLQILPANLFLTVTYLLSVIRYVSSDVFTAVCKMEALAKSEEQRIAALQHYVDSSKEAGHVVSETIESYLAKVTADNKISTAPHFTENPINAFHLVQRMYRDWGKITEDMFCPDCVITHEANDGLNCSRRKLYFVQTMDNIQNNSRASVTDSDVRGVAVAIVRLWNTYQLNLKELFSGRIYDTQTDPLTPQEILYIVSILDDRSQFYDEITWLETLMSMYEEDPELEEEMKVARVYRSLAGVYFKENMAWKSVELLEKYLQTDPSHNGAKRDLKYFKQRASEIPENEKKLSLVPPTPDQNREHYQALCRNEGQRSILVNSELHCLYHRTKFPYYSAKEEVLSIDPRISVFYDVITEDEQQYLKGKVYSLLETSGVVGEGKVVGGNKDTTIRVSETAWLKDTVDPVVKRLSLRIQLITGLSTQQYTKLSHAEDFQIVNYGIGGMYEQHPDWFGQTLADHNSRSIDPPELLGTGDRVATWLYYLNDVKAGGCTVFVNVNVTVPVVKGAAAFWYNVKRNGVVDPRTWHAGCPVLLGSKWISNKWIREYGQMFTRPCGMSPFALDGPFSSKYVNPSFS